jgi:perosamine synthetase
MIKHNKPTISLKELLSSFNIMKSAQLTSSYKVKELESQLGNFFGLEACNVALVSSGSAALYIVSKLLGLNNKFVGVPIYTCNAVSNAVKLSGANLKYIDSEVNSPNFNHNLVDFEELSALVAVSTFGKAAHVFNNHPIRTIEDFSQAFGSKVGNEIVGIRGLVGIASLSATKIFTTAGQGGIIVSKDLRFMNDVRDFINFDNRHDARFRFNFTLTEPQAGFGLAQIRKIPFFLKRREEIFQKYKKDLFEYMYNFHSDQDVKYRFILKTSNQDRLISHLRNREVQSIIPYHVKEFMDTSQIYTNATKFANTSVSLPLYPTLTNKEIKKIISSVLEFYHQR